MRVCTTKAAQIDTVLEQLRQHVLNLRNKGTLVKDTSAYKKQLLVRRAHSSNTQVKILAHVVDKV